VAHSRVRRKRMGHIELAAPVVHFWFFKDRPSILGQLLGLSSAELKKVIYHQALLVISPGDSPFRRGTVLTDEQAREASTRSGRHFLALAGGAAIEELLRDLDLAGLARKLRGRLEERLPVQERQKVVRRLEVTLGLLRSPNRPEWMVLHRIP